MAEEASNADGVGQEEAKPQDVAQSMPEAVAPVQKHPLQHRWALWFLNMVRKMEWEDCLKELSHFDTVEDFWALYNHIPTPGGLCLDSGYSIFKDTKQQIDQFWLELLMAIIGEQFEELGDHICGVVVNVREKGYRIALWTRDASADEANRRIGMILKSKLDIPDSKHLRYEVHRDSSVRTTSAVKPRILLPSK